MWLLWDVQAPASSAQGKHTTWFLFRSSDFTLVPKWHSKLKLIPSLCPCANLVSTRREGRENFPKTFSLRIFLSLFHRPKILLSSMLSFRAVSAFWVEMRLTLLSNDHGMIGMLLIQMQFCGLFFFTELYSALSIVIPPPPFISLSIVENILAQGKGTHASTAVWVGTKWGFFYRTYNFDIWCWLIK